MTYKTKTLLWFIWWIGIAMYFGLAWIGGSSVGAVTTLIAGVILMTGTFKPRT